MTNASCPQASREINSQQICTSLDLTQEHQSLTGSSKCHRFIYTMIKLWRRVFGDPIIEPICYREGCNRRTRLNGAHLTNNDGHIFIIPMCHTHNRKKQSLDWFNIQLGFLCCIFMFTVLFYLLYFFSKLYPNIIPNILYSFTSLLDE